MKNILAGLGVLAILGGESFCIFGPMTVTVHVVCHIILYSGMALVAGATALHIMQVRRKNRQRTQA